MMKWFERLGNIKRNMDCWNNAQGREIAKEIEKEYGKNFYNFTQQTRDDIFEQNLPPKYNKNSLTF